jgi:hypothetical protein
LGEIRHGFMNPGLRKIACFDFVHHQAAPYLVPSPEEKHGRYRDTENYKNCEDY